jgi:hypothetical protein
MAKPETWRSQDWTDDLPIWNRDHPLRKQDKFTRGAMIHVGDAQATIRLPGGMDEGVEQIAAAMACVFDAVFYKAQKRAAEVALSHVLKLYDRKGTPEKWCAFLAEIGVKIAAQSRNDFISFLYFICGRAADRSKRLNKMARCLALFVRHRDTSGDQDFMQWYRAGGGYSKIAASYSDDDEEVSLDTSSPLPDPETGEPAEEVSADGSPPIPVPAKTDDGIDSKNNQSTNLIDAKLVDGITVLLDGHLPKYSKDRSGAEIYDWSVLGLEVRALLHNRGSSVYRSVSVVAIRLMMARANMIRAFCRGFDDIQYECNEIDEPPADEPEYEYSPEVQQRRSRFESYSNYECPDAEDDQPTLYHWLEGDEPETEAAAEAFEAFDALGAAMVAQIDNVLHSVAGKTIGRAAWHLDRGTYKLADIANVYVQHTYEYDSIDEMYEALVNAERQIEALKAKLEAQPEPATAQIIPLRVAE